jgi:predicted transcriptional regulator
MLTPDPLDDIAFLARSAHRVAVLRTLAAAPSPRPDLHAETGIPQPTLGRILGDFEDRHWVERRSPEYALTSFGALVVDEFDDLVNTVETVQKLGDVIGGLPTNRMDFSVHRFGSATITTPQTGDVFRHVRRAEELINGAARVKLLTDTINPDSLGKLHVRVTNHGDSDLLVETVITEPAIQQALANRPMVGVIRELLESGCAPVYRYEGSIPLMLGLADDIAFMAATDDNAIPEALIETEDETIRTWVLEQFDSFRERSTELTVNDLPG